MKKICNPKLLSKVLSLVLMFSICILSLSPSAIAIEPEITPNYTLSSIRVCEYDYLTGNETEYDITIRVEELQSITEPSFPEGDVSPNTIIGTDTSTLVNTDNYSSYPYSAICTIYTDNRLISAFLVKKRIALTAAHCVYSDEWRETAYIMAHPPKNSTGSYIMENGTRVIKAIIPKIYKTQSNSNNDWAILVLEDDLGTANGTIGLSVVPPAVQNSVTVFGYHDKAMYSASGTITRVTSQAVKHTCDTVGGMSGSPICKRTVQNGTTKYTAHAIHVAGDDGSGYNAGTLINRYIVEKISALNSQYS